MYTFGPVIASLGNSGERGVTEAREPSTAQDQAENEVEDPYAMGWCLPLVGASSGPAWSPGHVLFWGFLSLQPPTPGSLWTLDQAKLSLPGSVLSPQASPGSATSV